VVILCAITSHFTTPIDKTMPMACFPIHHRPANTCWARPVSFFCHPAHRPAPVLPRGASMSHDSAAWHASTASTAPQRKGGRPCQFALSVALERSCVARHPVLLDGSLSMVRSRGALIGMVVGSVAAAPCSGDCCHAMHAATF
jgi:hypothetical protein